MAALHGLDGVVKVNVSATPTKIGLQRAMNLNLTMDDVDITSKDDAYWRRRLPSIREWTADFEAVYDGANTAQDQLYTHYIAVPSTVAVVTVAIGADNYAGNAFVTEFSIEAGLEDAVILSGAFRSDGAIAKT